MRAPSRRIRRPSCRTSSVLVISRTCATSLFLNTFFPSLNPAVTRIWSPTLTCIVEETSTSHFPLADGLKCRIFPIALERHGLAIRFPDGPLLATSRRAETLPPCAYGIRSLDRTHSVRGPGTLQARDPSGEGP